MTCSGPIVHRRQCRLVVVVAALLADEVECVDCSEARNKSAECHAEKEWKRLRAGTRWYRVDRAPPYLSIVSAISSISTT